MKTQRLSFRMFGFFLALWLMLSACGLTNNLPVAGTTKTDREAIELGSAESVSAQISMAAGRLTIKGGASGIMEGTFTYNTEKWKPRISYAVAGDQGDLIVQHPDDSVRIIGTVVNEWEIVLNESVPMNLQIDAGAGETTLDLHSLNLTDLQISVGAGNTNIDLTNDLDHDLNVRIKGGVGNVSVKLPSEMGVQVTATTGIGGLTNTGLIREDDGYVNEAYGQSPHTIFLNIESGIGAISLQAP